MKEFNEFTQSFLGDTTLTSECVESTSQKFNLSKDEVAASLMKTVHKEMDLCVTYSRDKTLFDYQKAIVDHFYYHRGIIAALQTGTGKTLVAISVAACIHNLAKKFGRTCNILIVTPASLVDNMTEEFHKFNYPFGSHLNIISSNVFRDVLLYQKRLREGVKSNADKFMISNSKRVNTLKGIGCNQNTFLIVDEAHEFKTDYLFAFAEQNFRAGDPEDVESRAKMFVEECYPHVWKVLLLTATPMLNMWYDIMNLIAAVKGVNPLDQRDKVKVITNQVDMVNTALDITQLKVDEIKILDREYFKGTVIFKGVDKSNMNFPKRNDTVYVPIFMPLEYLKQVEELMGQMKGKRSKKKKTEEQEIKELEALQKKLAFLPGNPKIDFVKKLLISQTYDKLIIYSRYINPLEGLKVNIENDIKAGLIPKYELFVITGEAVPPSKRQAYLQTINKSKRAVVFVSDAGGIGLDFKGLETAIVYEPGVNTSREEQFIGRAVRYQSHIGLPLEKRRVDIFKLIMRYPEGGDRKTVTPDQVIAVKALQKEYTSLSFQRELQNLDRISPVKKSPVTSPVKKAPVTSPVRDTKFHYVNGMDRDYDTKLRNITTVTFDISRYGTYTHTLRFKVPQTEKTVIEEIEEYLNQPLTKEYFDSIADDLLGEYTWDEAQKQFSVRGNCLSEAIFLEDTNVSNGVLTLVMGTM